LERDGVAATTPGRFATATPSSTTVTVEDVVTMSERLRALTLRVVVFGRREAGTDPVLDWKLVALSR
jgi:hypothetical protein